MQKLFLAICFIACLSVQTAEAKVVEMNEVGRAESQSRPIDTSLPQGMPDPNDLEAVKAFFRERFQTAAVSTLDDLGDLNKVDSISVQHSAEYIEQMQQEQKSTFEKIYDQAMARLSGENDPQAPSDTVFYEEVESGTRNEVTEQIPENLPVVNVTLPSGRKIMAPAREHIPYMLSSYTLLPTGLIEVQEDITVVANGQKLKHGLIKSLKKFSVSRAGVRKKLDIQLLSVTLNGQEIPHRLEEIGDKILIKPQKSYDLPAGVYTYSFRYLLDRKLWYYDDFSEFYVDVTGSYLNLVITSANAIVSVPDGRTFLSQNVWVGRKGALSAQRAIVAALDSNALGFASVTPLRAGEGMHILVALDKNVFLAPDINRRILWLITDYGDVLFALGGFLTVLISYFLSWKWLQHHKLSTGSMFKQTPADIRRFIVGHTDQRALIATLLELERKGTLEIRTDNGAPVIVRKSDRTNNLSRCEKNVIKALFPNSENIVRVSVLESLKFKRAMTAIDKGNRFSLRFLSLKSNLGYLLFSLAMLVFSEIAIALLAINPVQTFLILTSATMTMAFYIWMFRRRFKKKVISVAVKIGAVIFIIGAMLMIGVYVKLITAFLLLAMLYTIFEFDALFSKRNDILRSQKDEVEKLRKYLTDNVNVIAKTQVFTAKQPYIFALELTGVYPLNDYNATNYKLDLAEKMLTLL